MYHIQIPGYTAQNVTAVGHVGTVIAQVPVTITAYYTCNTAPTSTPNTAVMTSMGALVTESSSLAINYGTSWPLTPTNVYPQADATCASNPNCAGFGIISGNCCPNDSGVYNACELILTNCYHNCQYFKLFILLLRIIAGCSQCVGKAACAGFAQDNSTMCCPTRTNVVNSCCTSSG